MGYFPVKYDSRVVFYERKTFIRLGTGLVIMGVQSPAPYAGWTFFHIYLK